MPKESDIQSKIAKWLRSKGCFVWKCQQNATTQRGVADLFFCYRSKHGFLEVKKSANAPFRDGQKDFLEHHSRWVFAQVVYPENFAIIQQEIEEYIRDA